ncbi:M20 family metallopeptidase [Desulfurispira natronophila]|uniref:Acetylornithine deacetylase n=1 Tax=Desulfurispira natronophila TaxID=682562 RepID=A0A7W7Y576_9BACT|nr:M20/M25/M40 family metallo-hydrolase [Desulfurispira natronophila]MBB5022315.1 acetylornithine deacetylase [Desulfurispira natronophila]
MINEERLRKNLLEMIDIYSPSGKEEEILEYLETYLKEAQLIYEQQEVEEGRYNLIVQDENQEPRVAFVGHVDTVVPIHIDDYRSEEDGDTIYGLGSADMKGGVAAIIEAFATYRELYGTLPPAAMALVVGEEAAQDGAIRLVEEYGYDWSIVAEPTNGVPCFSHYGYLEMELSTAGRRVHASMAGRQTHAVKDMLRVLLRLSNFLDKKYPEIVYNIRDLNSTSCGFASPERCETAIDMHFPPRFPAGDLMAELEEELYENTAGIALETSFVTVRPGYDLPVKGPLARGLKEVYEKLGLSWNPSSFVSDSDAAILWREGIRTVVLGPGKLEDAHTQDESVDFASVVSAATIYLALMEKLAQT